MSMTGNLPRFIVIKSSFHTERCIYYTDVSEVARGIALNGEESVFSPFAKIEVEPSRKYDDNQLVHLRFCHNNKYWTLYENKYLQQIIASSHQPEEDTSKPSCTLFALTFYDDHSFFYLKHVQTGKTVYINFSYSRSVLILTDFRDYLSARLNFVNWVTLVKLPKHVAFKGDNGKYLRGDTIDGYPYLQFSSDDGNEKEAAYEVDLMPDGHVRIKSIHFGSFWKRASANWICAYSAQDSLDDHDTLFWPVQIDDTTIALRNAGNNCFCKRLTVEGKTNCITAAVSNMTKEARLEVEELVLRRKIYNVRYHWDDARIFNERPYAAGTTTAINRSGSEDTVAVKLAHVDSRAHTFTRSVSVAGGVKTTIEADLLCFAKSKIEISVQVTGSFVWGDTTTETVTVEATGTVKLAARSTAVVSYVGTQGTCNIPFSYTQEDQMSSDGQIVRSDHIDGVYIGVNCYNFQFEILEIVPL